MAAAGTLPQDVDNSSTGVSKLGEKGRPEGLKGPAAYWPRFDQYAHPSAMNASMVSLLYMAIFGKERHQAVAFK